MNRLFLTIIKDKSLLIISSVIGLIIGFFSICGYQIETYGNISFNRISTYLWGLFFALISWIIIILCMKLCERCTSVKESKPINSYLLFGLLVICLLILWLPQLLGIYPGYFNYDATGQWEMYEDRIITAHHPVLHTVVLGFIIDSVKSLTGSFNKGVFTFEVFQMIISSFCFSFVIVRMHFRNSSKWLLYISLMWFSLFPTIIINLFSITKDTLFSAFLVVFITMNLDILEYPDKFLKDIRYMSLWCIITFLTAIMRNNAIYVIVLFLPFFIWFLRKYLKQILPACASILVLYIFYIAFFCPLVTVDGVSSREFISVPAQQLMRVYQEKKDLLTQEEIDIYETLFDEVAIEYYLPKISDVVKARFNMNEFSANPSKYISFYIKQGITYPDVYINSFLHNTYGFWYPMSNLALDIFGAEGYFVCESRPPAYDNSKIPFIYNYYKLFEKSSLVYGDSPVKIIFAPATYLWIFLFTISYTFWKKDKKTLIVLLVPLLIFLTFLLGPVALVRYVSFLYYMIPFEVMILTRNPEKS